MRDKRRGGRSMHHFRLVTTGAAALAVLAFAALALAASGPVDVSGLSPFAACTVGGPGTNSVNSDVDQVSLSASADVTVSAVLVSKSTDGGDTWSEPTTLARNVSAFPEGPGFNDKESITADPTNANNVYAVWDRSRFPSDQAGITAQMNAASIRGDIMFSRTTDGGQNWEPARDILGGNQNEFTVGNQLAVLPNGTLVDIFEDLN